jgi:hypothetical protein
LTDDSKDVDIVPEDLKDFKAVFEGKAPLETPKEEDKGPEDTGDDDAPAPDEDEDAPEGDEDKAPEDSDEGDPEDDSDEDDPEDKPEPKKEKRRQSAQERINEITRRAREAERRETALLQRLEALEKSQPTPKQEPTVKDRLPQDAPAPDAVDENGEPKYPLGEFDKNFIHDLTEYMFEQKAKEYEETRTQQEAARQLAAEQDALKNTWTEKVTKYEDDVPEIREHIADLVDTFQGLEPQYGEFLATTIMSQDNGPAIMEYLSQNIGEAQKIVASGPYAATLAIGRLDARLDNTKPRPTEEKRNKRVSNAPEPPKANVKGSKGRTSVREDTDDYAAFKRDFKF